LLTRSEGERGDGERERGEEAERERRGGGREREIGRGGRAGNGERDVKGKRLGERPRIAAGVTVSVDPLVRHRHGKIWRFVAFAA
jgi:hypothetical protein